LRGSAPVATRNNSKPHRLPPKIAYETGRPLRRIEHQRLWRTQATLVAVVNYVDRNLVPSLLVLTALGARAPGANRIFRTIWHRGRELLTVAAVGNLTIVIAAAIQDPTWRLNSDWSSVLVTFLHIWALARIWMSPIIEKVLSEFPD
jgi:hypothetical protein